MSKLERHNCKWEQVMGKLVQKTWETLDSFWSIETPQNKDKSQLEQDNNIIKKICMVIGLKLCFCNSIETQNWHGSSKENLNFDDQS